MQRGGCHEPYSLEEQIGPVTGKPPLAVGQFSIGNESVVRFVPPRAVWLAERVRSAVETSSHGFGQNAFELTVSVGVAISDKERSDLNALLDAADRALYRA